MAIEVKIQRKRNTFELNIDFKSDSKRIGILGASGCGKSMTLKSIAGIEPPESGLIKIEGKTVYDSENKVNLKPQKRNIGYLFQNYALFPTMTVEKNIAAGLKGKKQENAKRVREMIEKFQLTGLEKRFPAELSGGQQQRVALARIMAYKPDVILLDEPFSALDMYLKDSADPSECLYFGDTNTDIKTGKNAKMTTVGVLWGFRGREELAAFQPEFLLEKPLDILTEIEK